MRYERRRMAMSLFAGAAAATVTVLLTGGVPTEPPNNAPAPVSAPVLAGQIN